MSFTSVQMHHDITENKKMSTCECNPQFIGILLVDCPIGLLVIEISKRIGEEKQMA